MEDILVFSETTSIKYATNTFINVPVILQYEDTPLIEVIKTVKAIFTTQISIYNQDGIYLAKVVGPRIFGTDAGKKAGLSQRYPKNMTVCELDGKTIFEIKRDGPAALSMSAELYTPDGAFIKSPSNLSPQLFAPANGEELKISGTILKDNTFVNLRIGILLKKDGSIGIGVP